MLRHVAMFKFKEGVTEEQKARLSRRAREPQGDVCPASVR